MERWTCGLLSVGKGWVCMIRWWTLGYAIMAQSAAVEDSEVEHKGTGSRRETLRVSGRVKHVGKKGCDPPKSGAFGMGARKTTILASRTTSSLVPLEGLPKGQRQPTRPSGPIGARTRFRLSKLPLLQRHNSSRLCLSNSKLMMAPRVTLFPRLFRVYVWIG